MNPTCSFELSAPGNGLRSSAAARSRAERSMTSTSMPNRSTSPASSTAGSGRFGAVKITLPLWMNVCTSPNPSDSTTSRSSAIGSLRPPTFTLRSSPTKVGTSLLRLDDGALPDHDDPAGGDGEAFAVALAVDADTGLLADLHVLVDDRVPDDRVPADADTVH